MVLPAPNALLPVPPKIEEWAQEVLLQNPPATVP